MLASPCAHATPQMSAWAQDEPEEANEGEDVGEYEEGDEEGGEVCACVRARVRVCERSLLRP